ncbi:MAG: hypothetical protein R2941_21285 [Desulfobacterales bacterium]
MKMTQKAIIFFSLILMPCMVCAAWESEILAEGEDLGVPYKSSVTIGVQSEVETRPSPPSPPAYSCSIRIAPADWSDYLATDIRKEGEKTYCWVVAVNPHGNAGTPVARTEVFHGIGGFGEENMCQKGQMFRNRPDPGYETGEIPIQLRG